MGPTESAMQPQPLRSGPPPKASFALPSPSPFRRRANEKSPNPRRELVFAVEIGAVRLPVLESDCVAAAKCSKHYLTVATTQYSSRADSASFSACRPFFPLASGGRALVPTIVWTWFTVSGGAPRFTLSYLLTVSWETPAALAISALVLIGFAEFCLPEGPLPPPACSLAFAFASITGFRSNASSVRRMAFR